jgi:signal transduction histidine kinase
MAHRKIVLALCIAAAVGIVALGVDLLVNGVILHLGSTPKTTFFIAFAIGLPLNYGFLAQREKVNSARDALLEAQSAREILMLDLERAVAEAEAANAAKSTFLATMSHEIRTPLNGVLGMALAMASGRLEPLQRDHLTVIQESGRALLTILNDILDLSKIEAGKLELESLAFDLAAVCTSVAASLQSTAIGRDVKVVADLDPTIQTCIGDPTRVRQIVGNLLSNALKFTESGEVRLQAPPWRVGRDQNHRHRHRHVGRGAGDPFQRLHSSRDLNHPSFRRHRPWLGDLPSTL